MHEENPPCTEHIDADSNGYCDKCGKYTGNVEHQHFDNNGDGKCDVCGITMSSEHQHFDNDGNGYCDKCGVYMYCVEHVDEEGDGYCDKCGEEMPVDDTAVRELFGVLDDFVANTGNIENAGSLGTDSEILFEVEQDGITKKIKIEFDVALDLLYTGEYGNNGLSMVVSIDDGSGFYERLFGI